MSVLSDAHIVGAILNKEIEVDPFFKDAVQPASLDVHLGSSFVVFEKTDYAMNPLTMIPTGKEVMINKTITIDPQEFMLATTIECIKLNRSMVARVEGVSSLGRVGLVVHSTAGYIDPGFSGQVTLELFNMAPWPLRLTPGMRVAQLAFERTTGPSSGYKGRYQNQSGATTSRYGSKYQDVVPVHKDIL